jgi:hypothetical protein
VGADGYREPGNVWCAVALFDDARAAEAALAAHERYLPSLTSVDESWHALLLPVATSEASATTSSAQILSSSSNAARRIPAPRCS